MNEFIDWLKSQMKKRDWGQRKTARESGLSPATINFLVNGKNEPTIESCSALARAFGEEPESVLKIAGLLGPRATPRNAISPEALALLEEMDEIQQRLAIQQLRIIREHPPKY